MCGVISKDVWTQSPHPKEKVVLGTKRLYSRKNGERGEVVKHKRRFVADGFRKIKEFHYEESSFPTPAAASGRMALTTMPVMDTELRHVDFIEAYLLADINIEIYIELPEEYREFSDAVSTGLFTA